MTKQLRAAIKQAIDAVAVKTYDFFLRVLARDVRALYADRITHAEFVDGLADLLEQQMRRAWNEGMRANGRDPQRDMTPDWESIFQNIVIEQFAYIDNFADAIIAGRMAESGVDQFIARVPLWANNYTSTVNTSILVTGHRDAGYVWRLGRTEKHCPTCAGLNGIVATAEQWLEKAGMGVEPQGDALICGGWNCDCRIEITDEPLTQGGIPNVPTQ
jgi:hypothetical protein